MASKRIHDQYFQDCTPNSKHDSQPTLFLQNDMNRIYFLILSFGPCGLRQHGQDYSLQNEQIYQSILFESSEGTDAAKRPKFDVVYEVSE